jgi:signal transduction histidine kinase
MSGLQRRRPIGLKFVLGFIGVGVLLVPIVFIILINYVTSRAVPTEPVMKLGLVAQELAQSVKIGKDGTIVPRRRFVASEGLRLVVADSEDRVIVSTSPAIARGGRVSLELISEAVSKDTSEVNFFAETIEDSGKRLGKYFAWFDENYDYAAQDNDSPNGIVAFSVVLGLAFAFGAFVAARLGRSVLRLERAALNIAAGDLETPVAVRGVREIEALAESMESMRLSIKEDRDRRARFLAAISHDLRTPLTSIGGYLEAVEDGLASDKETLMRYIGVMREKAAVLESRIAGLLEFARIETGEWRMRFEEADLAEFLTGLCRAFKEDVALVGRRFFYDVSAIGSLRARIDRELVSRAFENIVANALRFSPEGGEIRLSAQRAAGGRGVSIFIDDEGPGIDPRDRDRVFEPFARSGPPSDTEGTGLGLFIAHSVISGHGWGIKAESSPAGGCRIHISIPA